MPSGASREREFHSVLEGRPESSARGLDHVRVIRFDMAMKSATRFLEVLRRGCEAACATPIASCGGAATNS